jgi:hypothetical protein
VYRLLNFLDKNNVFYNKQFGFRAKHSTDYGILSIVDKIQTAIDNRDLSYGILVDFSKAFDTVNHDILIKKLGYYGIRGIAKNWFISYLSDRQQSIIIKYVTSDPMSISCGIPQGSVFGPIMFYYILMISIFALQSLIFISNKDNDTMEQNINSELSNVHTRLCSNGSVPTNSPLILKNLISPFSIHHKKAFLCCYFRNEWQSVNPRKLYQISWYIY